MNHDIESIFVQWLSSLPGIGNKAVIQTGHDTAEIRDDVPTIIVAVSESEGISTSLFKTQLALQIRVPVYVTESKQVGTITGKYIQEMLVTDRTNLRAIFAGSASGMAYAGHYVTAMQSEIESEAFYHTIQMQLGILRNI